MVVTLLYHILLVIVILISLSAIMVFVCLHYINQGAHIQCHNIGEAVGFNPSNINKCSTKKGDRAIKHAKEYLQIACKIRDIWKI